MNGTKAPIVSVLILRQPNPTVELVREIVALDPTISCVEADADVDKGEPGKVDAIIAWRMREGLAERYPNLQMVFASAAGVEKVIPSDLPTHVRVTRTVDPWVNVAIAQYVAMMALRHCRRLPIYEEQAKQRAWQRSFIASEAQTVGVLGLGETGAAIATALVALGFRVQGWSTRRRPDLPFPTYGQDELSTVLASSDILVNALPLTSATTRLLDARAFAQMPRGAYLINVARGAHVVEPDLVAAVNTGQLSGAALDVQDVEPLPADDPLWSTPGVTITPHIAGQASISVIAAQFVESYSAMRAGLPIPRTVDRTRGY